MANEIKQVGGTHYNAKDDSGLMHWDFVVANNMGYLEGCATKYVSRWQDKDGLKDLEKCEQYILKTMQVIQESGYQNGAHILMNINHPNHLINFCDRYELGVKEHRICDVLLTWKTYDDLYMALADIRSLLSKAYTKEFDDGGATANYVDQD